ncbi:MAG: DUF3794 domain-containing protein [Firmicutes bacterium]|nr:DUF3794 domain-containing protein [Bacillota bacterium]
MAYEPLYDKLTSDYKKSLTSGQVIVNSSLNALEGTSISKILAVQADVNITGSEALAKELKYAGRINFKVMYLCEENHVHGIDANVDFSDRLQEGQIVPGNRYVVTASILDIDTTNVSKSSVEFAAVTDVRVSAIVSQKVNFLKDGSGQLFTNKETISHKTLDAFHNTSLMITDEFSIDEGKKILSCDTQIILRRAVSGSDFVILEGEVATNICYTNGEDELFHVNHLTTFKEEVETNRVHIGSLVDATLSIKNTRCIVNHLDERNTLIRLEIGVDALIKSWSAHQLEVVADAFSPTNETTLVMEDFISHSHIASEFFEERIDSTATLDETAVRVDKIVAVAKNRLTIANILPLEDSVTIEGIVACNVVYLSVENEHLNSVLVDLPFSVNLTLEGVLDVSQVFADAIVASVSARARRGRDIQLTADIKLKVNAYKPTINFVIGEVQVGDAVEMSDSALSIYIVRAQQTLWEVVKELRTTPETVMAQNPTLTLPLAGGERIMFYRQLG